MPGMRTAPLASTIPRRVSTAPASRNMTRQRVRAARKPHHRSGAGRCLRAGVCGYITDVKKHPGPSFVPGSPQTLSGNVLGP